MTYDAELGTQRRIPRISGLSLHQQSRAVGACALQCLSLFHPMLPASVLMPQEARASAVDKAKAGLSEMERLQDDLDAARREKTKCLAALQLAEERARAGRSQLDADVARLTSDADGAAQRLSELLPRTVQAEAEWQLAKQALEQVQRPPGPVQ